MPFRIRADEIKDLSPQYFTDFMNRLLRAEASRHGLSPTSVLTTFEISAPDGGVDALVTNEESRSVSRWIPAGVSAWQFKTERPTPAKLKGELQKPYVKDLLAHEATYVPAFSATLPAIQLVKLRTTLAKKLLPADDLAEWATAFPSFCLLPYFQHPVGGMVRLEDWQRDPDHAGPYIQNPNADETVGRIRTFADTHHDDPHLRILGLRGVGKSRTVLQALSVDGLRERVLYADQPDDIPPGVLVLAPIFGNLRPPLGGKQLYRPRLRPTAHRRPLVRCATPHHLNRRCATLSRLLRREPSVHRAPRPTNRLQDIFFALPTNAARTC